MNRAGIPSFDDLVVGMEDEQESIIDRLIGGTTRLDLVWIVGMPGIGKTTIARNVCQNSLVVYHFHDIAWCFVSENYDVKKMLLEILSQITDISDEFEGWSYDDLAVRLHRNLKGRRYLIAMDDVWSTEAWDELKRCLPDDNKQSRVLLMSRQHLQFDYQYPPRYLRLLSEEESWLLLEKKVFNLERCPLELLDAGKMMAKRSEGLPLNIVVLSGILGGTEKNLDNWKEIAERVSSTDVQRESSKIFEQRYRHLPELLRPCFLYFGAFPKDYQIPVSKLIQLWIAEGFILRIQSKRLEDTAHDLLVDLINRSLVIVSERRSIGGNKTCCLHDSVQNFCLAKAEEEQFLQQIGRNRALSASGNLALTCHRFFICHKGGDEDFSTIPANASLGSLLCFQFRYWFSRRQLSCFSSYISRLKDLRVLELGEVCIDESFFCIQLPVRLTYLSVNGSIHSIPPSIADLLNLETLIVKGDEGTIQVPDSIWNMMKLRHLRIDDRASFKLPDQNKLFTLKNLQSLSYPLLSHGKDAEEILKALPSLRNLKCTIVQKTVSSSDFDSYPQLNFLAQLESLRVRYCGFLGNPSSEFNLPLWLKKLTLVHLPWNNISTLTRLPNLEVLKVLYGSFENDWCMQDDEEFSRLRILKLCGLRIRKWDASSDNFPFLEKLVVERCEKLEAIPLSFGEIYTLQLIDVKWCSHSLANSVRQIQEQQQLDLGNEEFQVQIYLDI